MNSTYGSREGRGAEMCLVQGVPPPKPMKHFTKEVRNPRRLL